VCNVHVMEPEDWIERRVVQLGHMTHRPSDGSVNGVMDVFKGSFGAGRTLIPHVITECVEVFVVGIIHKDVDILLQTRELCRHCIENLVFL
jgi:hypothetical protein